MGYTKNFYTEDEVEIVPITSNRINDLTGQKFGRLTVLGFAGRKKRTLWFCECTCGNITKTGTSNLTSKNTQSCGCLHVEVMKPHGMSISPEYRAYIDAKQRCVNPNKANYNDYGGRGIEFRFNCFEDFYKEIGDRPSNKHSLDRIDNEGHYETKNVRWGLKTTQMNNMSQNLMLFFAGEEKTLSEWLGGYRDPLYQLAFSRYHRQGWCILCAIIHPPYTPKPTSCDHKNDYRIYKRGEN